MFSLFLLISLHLKFDKSYVLSFKSVLSELNDSTSKSNMNHLSFRLCNLGQYQIIISTNALRQINRLLFISLGNLFLIFQKDKIV
ncbi:hypothetical protein BpHYR1_035341 [Brachionus plicatilis]|uniref:Uncharacterized protein n=1 Tax=Brachionus plicatilis TaxID=10195 RepID=A0A3M7PPJ0_BRAPC|nr:hypothetical protein BpHYR1_035341 [Brachionus plicatilis]